MASAIYNITADYGATENITCVDAIDGIAVDLTGYEVTLSIRHPAQQAEVLMTVANTGISLSDPLNGVFEIDLSLASYRALGRGTYDYSLQMTPPNDEVRGLLRGLWRIV